MKKLILIAASLASMFLAGSCQRENLEPAATGKSVTFNVEAPAAMQTKAIADGLNVNELIYEVYLTENKGQTDLADAVKLYQGKVGMTKVADRYASSGYINTAEVTVELLQDQHYTVLFWAQVANTGAYNTTNLTEVKYNKAYGENDSQYNANDESLAAFYAVEYITDGDPAVKDVTLRRPFAQLNLGTTNAKANNDGTYTIALDQSKVKVENVPTAFNVATSAVSVPATMYFKMYDVPAKSSDEADWTLTVNDKPYQYAGMNYLFASNDNTVTVTYDIQANLTTKDGAVKAATVNNTVTNVPLKENYRTNIIGNLLTSQTEYDIVVDADFYTNANSGIVEVITDGLVKNQNGDYEITNVEGFAYMVNNLWVDENGAANPATFYIRPGEYDFEGIQLNSVTVLSGTLKVVEDVPVITRSAITGVVLKGLTGSLINTVGSDATVVFSGITVQNFEGDDDSAALIGENDGKVIITDCDIIDENGEPDETTDLIGDADENGIVTDVVEDVEPSDVVYSAAQLAAAFAAENIEAISLGGNIAVEDAIVLPEGKTATLDLKGYEITIAGENTGGKYVIMNLGNLTIKDSYGIGKVNAGIYNGYDGKTKNSDATLVINSGNFHSNGYIVENEAILVVGGKNITGPTLNGLGAIRSNGGQVTVNSGVLSASSRWDNNTYQHILKSVNTATVINGGVFDATIGGTNNAMINVSENSTVTINGGDFRNVKSGETIPQFAPYMFTYEKNGKLIINDGSFYGGWRFNGETATTDIYGGNFTVSYDGQSFHANSTHVLKIYGGEFSLANGGKLNPSDHLAEGHVAFEKDGIWYAVENPVASDGNVVVDCVADLFWLAIEVNHGNTFDGKTVTLANDIDLNNEQWIPIGNENLAGETFNGIFDGNGKTISNLKHHYTGEDYFVGLFGCLDGATIKNLTITNVDINLRGAETWGHIGAVAGWAQGQTSLEDVIVNGDVKIEGEMIYEGSSRIGAVIGGNQGGNVSFKNVHVNASEDSYVKGNNAVGGIAGQLQVKANFENCSTDIDVYAQKFYAGGIIGLAPTEVTFTNCETSGNASVLAGRKGNSNDLYRVGAIAGGWDDNTTTPLVLTNCSYSGDLSGKDSEGNTAEVFDCGGFVGRGYSAVVGAKVIVNEDEYEYIGDGRYLVNGSFLVKNADEFKIAVGAIKDGGTIKLTDNVEFTESSRTHNSSTWYDGLYYVGDKSFTIDLGGKTISHDGSVNDYLLNFKNNGAKANEITLKNGTVNAGTAAFCALATASSNAQKMKINLENINLVNNNSNGAVIKFRGGAELNVKKGTVITGTDSYVGIEAVGNNTVVNVYEGAKIYQNGTTSYVGAIIGASYNATLNIYGGEGKSAKCGIIVMSTGATINVSGGEWTANGDGTVSNDNAGVLVSQNNRYESGWACKSILNVTGGTFKGGYNCYGMGPGVEADDAQINIKGGNFNANPSAYVANDYKAVENNGIWNVAVDPAAKIGSTEYATLQEAFNVGGIITLLRDVKVTETLVLAEGKTATLDLNGKTLSAADMNVVKNNGGNLTIKNGTVTRSGDVVGYSVNNASGEIVVENATIKCGLYTSGSKMIANNANISHEQSSRHAIYAWNCEVTINSGNYHNDNAGNATLMASGSSVVTINGGTFSIADGTSSLGWTSSMIDQNSTAQVIVKGGLFNGGFRINSADTKLTIEGGEFNTNNNSAFTDYSGTKVVKGGKFTDAGAQNWAKKYIAEGYEMNANGEVVAK